jgi:hypothetical protein
MHQFKLNAKAAFEGDVSQWHQEYGTWARGEYHRNLVSSGTSFPIFGRWVLC